MRKWLIALVMLATVVLAASSILLIPSIVASMTSGEALSNTDGGGRLGHEEFVPVDSMEKNDRVEISPGVYSQTIDVSGTLKGSPSSMSPWVFYANRIGPLGPGKLSWKSMSTSHQDNPISVTLIEDGNSIWTSAFSPTADGYIVSESPTFVISGDSYLVVANNNDAQLSYSISVTVVTN